MRFDDLDAGYMSAEETKRIKELLAIWDGTFKSLGPQDFSSPAFINHLKALAEMHEGLTKLLEEK